MKKYLIALIMLIASVSAFAEVGDTIRIQPHQIISITPETTYTKTGKPKTEIVVIFYDNSYKKKMATISQSDYKKLEQAQRYNLDIEYYIVELKTKYKLIVK